MIDDKELRLTADGEIERIRQAIESVPEVKNKTGDRWAVYALTIQALILSEDLAFFREVNRKVYYYLANKINNKDFDPRIKPSESRSKVEDLEAALQERTSYYEQLVDNEDKRHTSLRVSEKLLTRESEVQTKLIADLKKEITTLKSKNTRLNKRLEDMNPIHEYRDALLAVEARPLQTKWYRYLF